MYHRHRTAERYALLRQLLRKLFKYIKSLHIYGESGDNSRCNAGNNFPAILSQRPFASRTQHMNQNNKRSQVYLKNFMPALNRF